MTIDSKRDGTALMLSVAGRLETATAPQLEEVLINSLEGITALTFDFHELEYISSAGLRVVLLAVKKMKRYGLPVVKGANEIVKEVFEVTGFSDFLKIE